MPTSFLTLALATLLVTAMAQPRACVRWQNSGGERARVGFRLPRHQCPKHPSRPNFPSTPHPVAGGYKPIDNAANDADVQAAATFAVGAIDSGLKLVNITSASRQVVAGLNYRLTLTAAPANGTATSTYEAVVYQPLGAAPLQLTSYKKVDG